MTFYEAFSQNMEQLGLPAPRRLFDSVSAATATILAINKAIHTYGPRVSMRELFLTVPAFASTSTIIEAGILGAGISASFYVGACIGSLLVATGHALTLERLLQQSTNLQLHRSTWLAPAFAEVLRQTTRSQA